MRLPVIALVVVLGLACKRPSEETRPGTAEPAASASPNVDGNAPPLLRDDVDTHFKPLPKEFPRKGLTATHVELGRKLYFDERLSKNHDLSCNSCHDVARYGVDGEKLSSGHRGQLGTRNSPTVYNAGDHVAQFWDGRAANLEEQAKGPILNPVEMASSESRVVATLQSIPEYVALFKQAFGSGVTFHRAAEAIGAYERRLVTPGRFDKYLAGDETALDELEKRGLAYFIKLGCVTCHNGAAVGGGSFQKLGMKHPWPSQSDLGRFVVTKDEDDKYKFRVPSLRNVARTAPYFHDGSELRLESVVRKMAWHQLGVELRDDQASALVAFLNALTGELPKELITAPTLPASTPATPKPDPT
jgi:cytochrome c peroxidase